MPDAPRAPHTHVVQFYDDDADLTAGVGGYLIRAARDGAASVVNAVRPLRNIRLRAYSDGYYLRAGRVQLFEIRAFSS